MTEKLTLTSDAREAFIVQAVIAAEGVLDLIPSTESMNEAARDMLRVARRDVDGSAEDIRRFLGRIVEAVLPTNDYEIDRRMGVGHSINRPPADRIALTAVASALSAFLSAEDREVVGHVASAVRAAQVAREGALAALIDRHLPPDPSTSRTEQETRRPLHG